MALTKTKKLIECNHTLAGFSEAKVLQTDAKGRKRYRVVLLTQGKGNPRDKHLYTQACIDDPVTAKAFEGKPCFLNHPSLIEDQSQPERRVQDKGGWFDNVHPDGPALWADLTINSREAGDLLECIIQDCIEYSKTHPGEDYDGLSINANGESREVELDGEIWKQVDRITEAESVDAVTKAGRGGRFVAKLESLRKQKEVDAHAEEKLKQLGEILKSMRDKVMGAEDDFPLQSELRRQVDNALTLAGCGEQETEEYMPTKAQIETMRKMVSEYDQKTKTRESKAVEVSSDDKKAAFAHTHGTLKNLAGQVQDPATKELLMAHAQKYAPEGEGEGEGEGGGEIPGAVPDNTESDKDKEEKEKKAKEEADNKKKEKFPPSADKDKEKSEKDKEEREALVAENFKLKLEKRLAESGLPEHLWKLIETASKGRTIEEVDEIIEAHQEAYESNLRESSMPAHQGLTEGNHKGSPVLAGDPNFS